MSRWIARIVGLLILIAFIVLMVNLQNQVANLQQQLEEANRRYGELANRPATGGSALSVPLTNELTAFLTFADRYLKAPAAK